MDLANLHAIKAAAADRQASNPLATPLGTVRDSPVPSSTTSNNKASTNSSSNYDSASENNPREANHNSSGDNNNNNNNDNYRNNNNTTVGKPFDQSDAPLPAQSPVDEPPPPPPPSNDYNLIESAMEPGPPPPGQGDNHEHFEEETLEETVEEEVVDDTDYEEEEIHEEASVEQFNRESPDGQPPMDDATDQVGTRDINPADMDPNGQQYYYNGQPPYPGQPQYPGQPPPPGMDGNPMGGIPGQMPPPQQYDEYGNPIFDDPNAPQFGPPPGGYPQDGQMYPDQGYPDAQGYYDQNAGYYGEDPYGQPGLEAYHDEYDPNRPYGYDHNYGGPPPPPPGTGARDFSSEPQKPAQNNTCCIICFVVFICIVMIGALISTGVVLALLVAREDDDSPGRSASLSPNVLGTPAPQASSSAPSVFAPSPAPAPTRSADVVLSLLQTVQGEESSLAGSSVALSGAWFALGAPATGEVATFLEETANFVLVETLTGPNQGTAFGNDVDFSNTVSVDPFLLVGDPQAPAGNTGIPAGAAYFYAFSRGSSSWVLEGNALSGGLTPANANEGFGTAVALSDNYRVIVGAPFFQGGNGRAYTFEFTQVGGTFDWVQMADPILGDAVASNLGSDVDITSAGNTIVVGEPGTSGFIIYEWVSSIWSPSLRINDPLLVDLGSAVKFLGNDHVAIGAPSVNNGAGTIIVFQRDPATNTWSQLNSLTGVGGERIGTWNTVDGNAGINGPELTLATADGKIQRYDLIQGVWVRRFEEIRPGVATGLAVSNTMPFTVLVGYAGDALAALYRAGQFAAGPTPSPTTQAGWRTGGAALTVPSPNSGYGSSLAVAENFFVAGLPDFSGIGGVQPFEDAGAGYVALDVVFDEAGLSEELGSAVDVAVVAGRVSVVAGAQNTEDVGNQANFGAAYYYEYDGENWNLIGSVLRPIAEVFQAGGLFGAAVAMASSIQRVAIGAPSSSSDTALNIGRVYTYEYDGQDWQEMTPNMFGSAETYYGTSLDMSPDGALLLVGAPGDLVDGTDNVGLVQLLEWNGGAGQWDTVFETNGAFGDSFGASVTFLDEQAEMFAVGGPTSGTQQGVVRMYGRSTLDGQFQPVGQALVGAEGERIGRTVAGSGGRVAFGTDLGTFRAFEFNFGSWIEIANGGSTGSPVTSIAMANNGDTIIVGLANEEVRVYNLFA